MTIGSLFSGIGGLELGLEACGLGPVVWQAESDPYAYNVLAYHWPDAIRYRDVRRIDASAPVVQIICGGFPCQDVSVAGKGAGLAGKRSGLWSEFARIVRTLRPAIVFIENVAALRRRGLDRVLEDLASCGLDAEWGCFRADEVGAPHRRERIFILAYAGRDALRVIAERIEQRPPVGGDAVAGEHGACVGLADASCAGLEGSREGLPGHGGDDVANAARFGRREGKPESGAQGEAVAHSAGDALALADADGGGCEVERGEESDRLESAPGRLVDGRGADGYVHRFPPGPGRIAEWDGPQPAVRRGAHGLQGRMDRLRCLGNAVVPQVAALAFATLTAQALSPTGAA